MKLLRALAVLLAASVSQTSFAALSILQNVAIANGNSDPITKAFPSALTTGSVIVVCVTAEDRTITATASDGQNGSYGTATANATETSGNTQVWIWVKANTSTTTSTVSVDFSASPGYAVLKIYEISGQNSTPVDVSNAVGSTDGVPANLSFTTTAANDIVIGCINGYPNGYSVDSGYTQAFAEQGGSNSYHWGEYIADAGAAGAKTLTFGVLTGTGRHYNAAAVAIAPFSAGGGTVVNPISGKGGAAARPIVN